MAAIPRAALYLGVLFWLMVMALAGQAVAQTPPPAQPQVCDRSASGSRPSDPAECCCAAPAKPVCCAVAPAGPRKECLADDFRFVLPAPYRATQAVVSADGALVLGRRVTVRAQATVKDDRAFGEVANLGDAGTNLDAEATVGSLLSNGKVTLGEDVTVNGPLTVGGTLVVPATARLNGKVTTNTPIHAAAPTLATVTFSPAPDVHAPGGATRALPPGRYGEVQVEPGGTLALRAGTYYMASLSVLSDATLALDEKDGAVVVFVKTRFTFAGEEKQEGSNGHVLIATFGCEPSALLAPFRGTVSAQNAWLSMTAPGRPTFVGRFFANSIDVGADTTIVGLPVTLPTGPVQVSGGQAPQPPAPLPAPPADVGCYVMSPSGWRSVACATQQFIDSHFPHPDTQLAMSTFTNPFKPLTFGQVAVTIPQVASEKNVFNATTYANNSSICPSSVTSSDNTWSVQNNVNDWTIASGAHKGDSATVQFVIQSDGSTSGICIWQIDVTTQDYPNKCYAPSPSQRSGGLQAFDYGNIAATVEGGKLKMVAGLSWVGAGESNQFAVVADDTYDMADSWSNVGGGLLGIGNCSEAQLTSAEVVTQVAASTCAGDTTATSPTCSPPALQPNASATEGAIGTVETNNLTAIGAPSVAYPNVDLAVTSLTGTTSGTCLGPSHAYVKDSEKDFGATPSTIGEAVFWESPDIFLVPHGTPVDVNAVSTETTITPGGQFDIWVRVHNDLGCADVNNAKALVYLADPAALSVQWAPVTMGQYVGDNGGATGVTVPAGGQALIGPLPFTAPMSGLGIGHRCILAAIQANGEPAPANPDDTPQSNQVAQRNIQFADPCVFPLTNGTSQNGSAQITLTATPNTGTSPSLTALPDIEVAFDDSDSSWFNAWKTETGAGTSFQVTHAGSVTTVRLGDFSVALNAVPLAAGQSRNAKGTTVLPSGAPGAVTLQIAATLTETNGSGKVIVTNGGSCVTSPPPVIR